MNKDQVESILTTYNQQVENIKEALRVAGVPEPLVAAYTFNLPNIAKMLPEDVVKLFKDFREIVIFYLDNHGFSQREIERRMGGDSLFSVNNIIKKHNQKKGVPTT